MKVFFFKKNIWILFSMLGLYSTVQSQENELKESSSSLYNGLAFNDNYRVLNTKNRFLNQVSEYETGSIKIGSNVYNDLNLKLDLYKDELILKPYYTTTNLGIIVNKDEVEWFSIKKQLFYNLNKKFSQYKFINGYYELKYKGKKSTLYLKHEKKIYKILTNERIHYEYELFTQVIVEINNELTLIESKKDLIKLFPDSKEAIKLFYKINSDLEKQDKARFYDYLLTQIDRS